MPCSVLIFVKVEALAESDIIALLASVLFYIAVFVVLALVFNHPDPRNVKMEHPIVKDGEGDVSQDGDVAHSSESAIQSHRSETGIKEGE